MKKVEQLLSVPPVEIHYFTADMANSPENRVKDEAFLADICTPAEIRALEERWQVARLLDKGSLSYREISKQTGASTTTVTAAAIETKNATTCDRPRSVGTGSSCLGPIRPSMFAPIRSGYCVTCCF